MLLIKPNLAVLHSDYIADVPADPGIGLILRLIDEQGVRVSRVDGAMGDAEAPGQKEDEHGQDKETQAYKKNGVFDLSFFSGLNLLIYEPPSQRLNGTMARLRLHYLRRQAV